MLVGDKNEMLKHRLGNQHPIERIAMRTRQGARDLAVPEIDG